MTLTDNWLLERALLAKMYLVYLLVNVQCCFSVFLSVVTVHCLTVLPYIEYYILNVKKPWVCVQYFRLIPVCLLLYLLWSPAGTNWAFATQDYLDILRREGMKNDTLTQIHTPHTHSSFVIVIAGCIHQSMCVCFFYCSDPYGVCSYLG